MASINGVIQIGQLLILFYNSSTPELIRCNRHNFKHRLPPLSKINMNSFRIDTLISSGVEQALHRVLSLINDEMMKLAWNLQDDLQGIKESTAVVIDLSPDAQEQQTRSASVRLWLIKLEEVAYDAEHVLNELSYELLRGKVRYNSLRRIRFLKNVVFNSQLAQKVTNLNKVLRVICNEAYQLKLSKKSGGYLLFRLRLCWGFCLGFPKDFLIQKTDLIQLWIAAGFLQSFDEGSDCCESLVSSSFLKDGEKDDDGNVVSYETQGLGHVYPSHYNTSRERFLYATTSMAIPKDRANKLRTLILDGVQFQESWKLGRLGILVFLNNKDMEMLQSSFERLKHLTYLDVSKTRIRVMPKFITQLYNLQTLRFLECKELNELPKQLNNLINLKNIAFSFQRQMPFRLGNVTCLETLSFFVVGSDRGGSIKELRHLNTLKGELEITRLEKVRDKKEAERANLQQKEKINELSFQWSYGAHDRSSSDEKLLKSLQPHPNVKKIKIKYYMGENWPSWMLRTRSPSHGDSFVLHNLVSLTLERCWNCTQLPCLEDLSFLRFLTIRHMEKVKYIYKEIDSESNGPRRLFPALTALSLSWMENLTEWGSTDKPLDEKRVVAFPSLKTLSIQSCAKLTSFPMNDLSALLKIEIKDCDELSFLFPEQLSFPPLTNLFIEGCPKLTRLQNWLLSFTRFLKFRVRRCEWLKFIPDDLGLQRSLSSLEINCCRGLTFFSEEILCKLTQLRKLSIGAFSENLDGFHYLNRIKDLPLLEELEIWGSDFLGRKMSHLPDQLQHLTGLKSLKIMGFTTMEALPDWLSDLQSLHSIYFNYCWHLEYQSTATITQRLSDLKQLYIYGCHTLEQNKSQWNGFSLTTNIRIHFSKLPE